ncbi:hypothetical protein JHK87_016887 [Glycine soja]|nr:hypothetical protein JHK87_016887 [Glycine soja]
MGNFLSTVIDIEKKCNKLITTYLHTNHVFPNSWLSIELFHLYITGFNFHLYFD